MRTYYIRALVLLGMLLIAFSTSPVSASVAPAPVPAAYDTQETAGCTDEIRGSYFAGNYHEAGTLRIDGVKAYVDPTIAGFKPCSTSEGPATHDAASVWVGIEPGAATGDHAVLQIGITSCNDWAWTMCDGQGNMSAWWSAIGCTTPYMADLGPISSASHQYTIERYVASGGAIRWRGLIDGVSRFDLASTDSKISCFINGDTRAIWTGELWDGADSYSNADDKLNVTNIFYKTEGGSYVTPNWDPASACNTPAENSDTTDHKCDRTSTGQGFDLWSVPY